MLLPRCGSFTVARRRRFDRMLSLSQSFLVLRFGGLRGRRTLLLREFFALASLRRAFAALLLFFLFLWSFLDSRKLSQDLFALFRRLGAPGQLDRENLLHDFVELRP